MAVMYWSYCFIKGQAAWFGLAWLPAVCENIYLFFPVFLIISFLSEKSPGIIGHESQE